MKSSSKIAIAAVAIVAAIPVIALLAAEVIFNSEVKDTGVIQLTVIRPLKRFLKSECEAFYNGSVTHPTATRPHPLG